MSSLKAGESAALLNLGLYSVLLCFVAFVCYEQLVILDRRVAAREELLFKYRGEPSTTGSRVQLVKRGQIDRLRRLREIVAEEQDGFAKVTLSVERAVKRLPEARAVGWLVRVLARAASATRLTVVHANLDTGGVDRTNPDLVTRRVSIGISGAYPSVRAFLHLLCADFSARHWGTISVVGVSLARAQSGEGVTGELNLEYLGRVP